MLREDNRRKGFFEAEEYRRGACSIIPEDLKPVIQTAYITGWRIASEILTRQKHHVRSRAGWLRLEPGEAKNGEGRNFPLMPGLREVLEWQIEKTRAVEQNDRTESSHGSSIKMEIRSGASAKLGQPRVREPACRGAFRMTSAAPPSAIWNAPACPRSAAMAMVGHRTESIYRRYAIADEAMLKESATKLAAFHALEGSHPNVVPRRTTNL